MKRYFQGILGAALLLAAVSASAQIKETVAVKVPFSFVAAGKTWPAADYRFQIVQPVGLVTMTTPGMKQASFVTNTDQHPGAEAGRTFLVSAIQRPLGSRRSRLSGNGTAVDHKWPDEGSTERQDNCRADRPSDRIRRQLISVSKSCHTSW